MLGECFGLQEVGKVFMIHIYLHWDGYSLKVVLPFLEDFDNS